MSLTPGFLKFDGFKWVIADGIEGESAITVLNDGVAVSDSVNKINIINADGNFIDDGENQVTLDITASGGGSINLDGYVTAGSNRGVGSETIMIYDSKSGTTLRFRPIQLQLPLQAGLDGSNVYHMGIGTLSTFGSVGQAMRVASGGASLEWFTPTPPPDGYVGQQTFVMPNADSTVNVSLANGKILKFTGGSGFTDTIVLTHPATEAQSQRFEVRAGANSATITTGTGTTVSINPHNLLIGFITPDGVSGASFAAGSTNVGTVVI